MIRGVLFGAKYTTAKPLTGASLEAIELAVQERIKSYRTTAAVEGGITGAGGFVFSLADFPLLTRVHREIKTAHQEFLERSSLQRLAVRWIRSRSAFVEKHFRVLV